LISGPAPAGAVSIEHSGALASLASLASGDRMR
jgi:hypothetical protein